MRVPSSPFASLASAIVVLLCASPTYGEIPDPQTSPSDATHLMQLSSSTTRDSKQLIIITVPTWTSQRGTQMLFERNNEDWIQRDQAIAVSLGQNGLGWGLGLQPVESLPGPRLTEGDARAPAGIFAITGAFGDEASLEKELHLPFRLSNTHSRCVDDPASAHYNTILDDNAVPSKDWRSAEPMYQPGSDYHLGIIFSQNTNPTVPNRGSCIFLHRGPPNVPTLGCTTLPEPDLLRIAKWLNPALHPLLVQLPESEYAKLQNLWDLPPLPSQ